MTLTLPTKFEHRFQILRFNIMAETRKILNYAWSEQSQKKFWWKFVRILTCKLIFRIAY